MSSAVRVFSGLALALMLAGAARGDFRDDYKAGVEAFESGQWARAVSFFRSAIRDRAEARGGFRRYTPHYYLGAALARQGKCREALVSWEEAERQGQIQKTRDYQDLRRGRQSCENTLAGLEKRVEEAEALLAEARAEARELEELARQPALAATWSQGGRDSLASQQAAAEAMLERAEQSLARGRDSDDPEPVTAAKREAESAMRLLAETASMASSRLADQRQAAASAREDLERVESNAERTLRSLGDLRPFPPQLGRRAAAVERALEALRAARDRASSTEMARLSDELTVAVSQLRRASERPPARLSRAAASLLSGDYAAVLETLAGTSYRGRSLTLSRVLRAAAQHGLFVLGGGENPELFLAARENVLASAGEDLEAPPLSESYLSPAFRRFVDEILSAAAAEAAGEEDAGEGG